MSEFELRGKTVKVVSADVYQNTHPEAPLLGPISEKTVIIRGVVLAARNGQMQAPFAYLDEGGFWVNEAEITE